MSDVENTLKQQLRGLGADIREATDLEQRIAQRRIARKLRRFHRNVAIMSALVITAIAATVARVVPEGAPSHQVATAAMPVTGISVGGQTAPEPTAGQVYAGRFTSAITLDGGALTVTPAPPNLKPSISQTEATTLVGSDFEVHETGWSRAVGFGEVSIDSKLFPGVERLPAWVAFIKQPSQLCTNAVSPARPSTSAPVPSRSPGYLVVVVEGRGTKVLDYYSRDQVCGLSPKGPRVADATQLLSVPWEAVSLRKQTLTFRYQQPACDPYATGQGRPLLSVGGNAQTGHWDLQVLIESPYNLTYPDLLHCGGPWITASTNIGPIAGGPNAPPPSEPAVVTHAPTGPVGGPT